MKYRCRIEVNHKTWPGESYPAMSRGEDLLLLDMRRKLQAMQRYAGDVQGGRGNRKG